MKRSKLNSRKEEMVEKQMRSCGHTRSDLVRECVSKCVALFMTVHMHTYRIADRTSVKKLSEKKVKGHQEAYILHYTAVHDRGKKSQLWYGPDDVYRTEWSQVHC